MRWVFIVCDAFVGSFRSAFGVCFQFRCCAFGCLISGRGHLLSINWVQCRGARFGLVFGSRRGLFVHNDL